ncbi:MAG: hypothetical protein AB1847_07085 [bacterium]
MFKGKKAVIFLFIFITLISISILLPALVQAQANWAAMPPYNVLWPLWSPALSPGGTPLVTNLTRNTILPVQPALAWDPLQPAGTGVPWALYNTPTAFGGGLLYFDLYYGLNPWPPSYMVDAVSGAPKPITLPLSWSVLLPTALKGLEYYVPLANAVYSYQYGVPLTSLLTSASIWGLPPL